MKIEIKDGRVIFSGNKLEDATIDIQLKSNDLLGKVKNNYTLAELIEMTKVKARSAGLNIDFLIEKID